MADKQLAPTGGTYSAGTQFAVVAVTTSLLAAPAALLAALWGTGIPIIAPLAFAGVAGTAIPLAILIDDNPLGSPTTPIP